GPMQQVDGLNWVIVSVGVIRKTASPPAPYPLATHTLSSGPVVMPARAGLELAGKLTTVIAPLDVLTITLPPPQQPVPCRPQFAVNHRLPSGPAVIMPGALLPMGSVNSVITPPGVIRPILLPGASPTRSPCSVNQRLPSGPAAMSKGSLLAGLVPNGTG